MSDSSSDEELEEDEREAELSESVCSASSASDDDDSGYKSDTDSDSSDSEESLVWRVASLKSKVEWRWSATAVARLLVRLELADALPLAWSPRLRGHRLGLCAARLMTRSAARAGSYGAAKDGAQLLRHTRVVAGETLLRRTKRVAARYADVASRTSAKAALRCLVESLKTEEAVVAVEKMLHSNPNDADALDCLRSLMLRAFHPKVEALAQRTLDTRLEALLKDGDKGYDALHGNVDVHSATLGLARLLVLKNLHVDVIAEKKHRLRNLSQMLQRRLRRPEAARREPLALTTTEEKPREEHASIVGGTPGEKEQSRFLLHILAENLDYLLQDLLL